MLHDITMKIIKPSFEILTKIPKNVLKHIELCGKTCYKSEHTITKDSAPKFVANIIKRNHESVLEHYNISVRIICDRGVSHEIVRHRTASFSQESTRYCNYGNHNQITVIAPCFFEENTARYNLWSNAIVAAEDAYLELLKFGATPQEARSVLPNSLKTELIVTLNLRGWRHFFKLRAANACGKSHPQMLEITVPMLKEFKKKIPIVFDDICSP